MPKVLGERSGLAPDMRLVAQSGPVALAGRLVLATVLVVSTIASWGPPREASSWADRDRALRRGGRGSG
ncbi:hypothetical protein V2J56_13130 [Georgenia sp. MJ206]|uniref:hypothetical protein n=1 Tax=Georgenia wangjunii TaxID=3117730 RepID=UPI002F268042